ncbi:hypothetical protein [Paraburkholderia sp. BCC1884]|uniref:hypothetical protein n=1 Tax=Paraburkholderia sp. BCC1884 TaxID=2562668 RepID=UPI001182B0AE|nr:hypothetical protein [Paraburkholderia sp. BCC1884]
MRRIKLLVLFSASMTLLAVGPANARTDPICLKHLGGGLSDADCYGGLANDVVAENKSIYNKIRKTIPGGNEHLRLLNEYMSAQDQAEKFCKLARDAEASWDPAPDGTMYPGIYAECVFDLRKQENKFLRAMLDSTRE